MKQVITNYNKSKRNDTQRPTASTNVKQVNYSQKDTEEQTRLAVLAAMKQQDAVDAYNNALVYGYHDERFDDITLVGDNIIIKLYHENFIKSWMKTSYTNEEGEIVERLVPAEMSYSQIDGRTRDIDKEQYIDNPLPYIMKGVIVAIAPSAKEKLKSLGVTVDKGSIVSLSETTIKDRRYYLDKQVQSLDYVRNQRTTNLSNFEGTFTFGPYDIESIDNPVQPTVENVPVKKSKGTATA